MALPQRHRLRGQKVFDQLYRQGRRFQSESLMLRLMQARPTLLPPGDRRHAPSPWRCGVVVSSKVSKRAVQRNRLRRLLHQHMHAQLRELAQLEPGLAWRAPQQQGRQPTPAQAAPPWLLLSLKPNAAAADPARLLEECTHLLRQAGLLP